MRLDLDLDFPHGFARVEKNFWGAKIFQDARFFSRAQTKRGGISAAPLAFGF
jgi:hypothetical protein